MDGKGCARNVIEGAPSAQIKTKILWMILLHICSLNQSGILPDIQLVNAAFVIKESDYVKMPDSPPQSVDQLFALVYQMKEDFNLQLKKRDEAIASLSLCISELQEEIKKEVVKKTKKKKMMHLISSQEEDDASHQQPRQDVTELKESVEL